MKTRAILLILILLISGGCSAEKPTATEMVASQPVARVISIDPARVNEGDEVKFSGIGESGSGKIVAYKWRSGLDGVISNQASFNTKTLSEGKHKIFFSVEDDKGKWSLDDTGDVVVSPRVLLPKIDYFRTDPGQIGLNEKSTLSWHVSGATVVSIDNGVGQVNAVGKITVKPDISTRYTLNATNAGGNSSSHLDVIVVPTKNFNLPVVRSFAADPGSIIPGQFSTLKWEVDNAETVQIDPGIGFSSPVGSAKISPTSTTKYTLTAYNSIGVVIGTTQILVELAAQEGSADLVLTDIYKMVTANGVRIGYSIENRGSKPAPSTESKLFVNGILRDTVSVPVIPAQSKLESQFNKWSYDPSLNIVEIRLDADGTIVESNKSNNILQIVFPVSVKYDFILNAPLAQWSNGYQTIEFGGLADNIEGAAVFRTDKRLEDSSGPAKYLETRPRATFSGFITGDYFAGLEVKPGDSFYGIVGLLEAADAGNVVFEVYCSAQGESEWSLLGKGVNDIFEYKLKSIDLPIPSEYFGKKVDFRIKVYNNSEPLQNWAVWVDAKIIR